MVLNHEVDPGPLFVCFDEPKSRTLSSLQELGLSPSNSGAANKIVLQKAIAGHLQEGQLFS